MATTISTTIVTLYDDSAKTKAFAPRTKVSAISNDAGTGLQALLDNKLNTSGGTITGNLGVNGTFTLGGQATLSWNSSKNAIQISFITNTPSGPTHSGGSND